MSTSFIRPSKQRTASRLMWMDYLLRSGDGGISCRVSARMRWGYVCYVIGWAFGSRPGDAQGNTEEAGFTKWPAWHSNNQSIPLPIRFEDRSSKLKTGLQKLNTEIEPTNCFFLWESYRGFELSDHAAGRTLDLTAHGAARSTCHCSQGVSRSERPRKNRDEVVIALVEGRIDMLHQAAGETEDEPSESVHTSLIQTYLGLLCYESTSRPTARDSHSHYLSRPSFPPTDRCHVSSRKIRCGFPEQ